ncbi:hypothetical protein [Micromonospora zhanjiangensis]|uniref:Late embryogenesis abundant protein n=1 Tax=Micromonospora zhanjiangensis TaxID=1522057 RepID=A0ABV8KLA8_9ACTN
MTEQSKQVGQHAAQAGGEVAQTAQQEGRQVAQEAKTQARDLMGETRGQLQEQARQQQHRAASGLRGIGSELRSMTDRAESSGPAAELLRQAGGRIDGAADWLENREPGQLVEEVRGYARRHPVAFLAGAAALGVLAGRLTRNVTAASHHGPSSTAAAPSGAGDGRSSYGRGQAGTGQAGTGTQTGRSRPAFEEPAAYPTVETPYGEDVHGAGRRA